MIRVEQINESILHDAIEFLTSVPSIDKIDEKILNNACIAYDDDKIVGCISLEEFSNKGLIRYFVFKKVLSIEYLEQLLKALEEHAKEKGIEMLVCIAECSQIEELFRSLDFQSIPQSKIFINEENVLNTNFKSALFLNKVLV
ncbi:MAG: GNAT family N-acetyltransferase [Anaeroplasmataceae bacterium]|nr:GNAT family N-acetyltransferase [Anaeroplasmataceae bacterium]